MTKSEFAGELGNVLSHAQFIMIHDEFSIGVLFYG